MGLYGDDDYKSYTRVSLWGDFHSRKVKPQIVKKDFRSDAAESDNLQPQRHACGALRDGRCGRI